MKHTTSAYSEAQPSGIASDDGTHREETMSDDNGTVEVGQYVYVAVPPITRGLQKRCSVAATTLRKCVQSACEVYDLPVSATDPSNWESVRDITEESRHRNKRLFRFDSPRTDGPYHVEEVLLD